MLKLREFNLHFAFARAGALRENVEDERGAIQNFALKDFFKVAALRGRKFVVENHRVHFVRLAEFCKFLGLAFADERGGVKRFQFLNAGFNDFAAGGRGEFAEFGERILQFRAVARFKFDADKKNPFGALAGDVDKRFQWSGRHFSTNGARRD